MPVEVFPQSHALVAHGLPSYWYAQLGRDVAAGTRLRAGVPRDRRLHRGLRRARRRWSHAGGRCTPSRDERGTVRPWTAEPWGRLGWALPWLLFLAFPIADLVTTPRPVLAVLVAAAALAAFTIAYLMVFGRVFVRDCPARGALLIVVCSARASPSGSAPRGAAC